MSRIALILVPGVLFVFLSTSDITAQWRQLPVPSVHGRLGSGPDGTLWLLTNGTLCHFDSGTRGWIYQPFPYDLNIQISGQSQDDPPRQLVVAAADTLVFMSWRNDEYYIVRGEPSLHSAMNGLPSKRHFGSIPYLFSARGKNDELLLCHDDLYRSTNNGVSWELKYRHPMEVYSFNAGAVDERNRDVLFLHESTGATYIHKSVDDGATWRTVYHDTRGGYVADMLVCPEGQIYSGVFFSSDSGESWTRYRMDPNLHEAYFSAANFKYIYNPQANGIFVLNGGAGLFFRDLDDPTFRKTALASSTNTERARGGVDLAYERESGRMYAIINDSLYEYHRGTVTPMTPSVGAAAVTGLVAYNRNGDTLLLSTPRSTVKKSTDGGQTWHETGVWCTSLSRVVFAFSKTTKNLIYNYGLPSPEIMDIIENGKRTSKHLWYSSGCRLAYDPFSTDTFYGGEAWVWRMTDSIVLAAEPSEALFAEIFVDSLPIYKLQCIRFDERRQGVMLLGGSDLDEKPFLYRTNDLGAHWERIRSIPLNQPPIDILFDPGTPNRILVADPTGLYISNDDGVTWSYRDPGLGAGKATSVAFDPDNASRIFLGAFSSSGTEAIPQSRDDGGGVWRSTDGGDTWGKLPIEGLNNYNISHVLVLCNPKRVLVGTSCGAYEYILDSTTSIIPPVKETTPDLRMHIYPNPGSGTVNVRYMLDVPSRVRLSVYDVLGRIVASKSVDAAVPGELLIPIDTDGLMSGIYILTLETATEIHTRRVSILR